MKLILVFSALFTLSSFQSSCTNPKPENVDTEVKEIEQKPVKHEDLNLAEFKERWEASENAVLVDVRTPNEIADGKIEGALEFDFYADDFKSKIVELDKDKEYFMYCRSGNRSGQASKFMVKNGFTKVYNLKGGYMAWSANKE